MELGVRVVRHRDAGLEGGQDERTVVEAVAARDEELVLRTLRRQLCVCRDGAEVGHKAENAIGLLRFVEIGIRGLRNSGSGGRLCCGSRLCLRLLRTSKRRCVWKLNGGGI